MRRRDTDLTEEAPIQILLDAERYMEERKVKPQPVGTNNVLSEVNGPVSFTGNLTTASQQDPNVGMIFLTYTVKQKVMDDLFCRVITKLTVGGNWYRPSNELAAVKAGQTPYRVQVFPQIVGVNTRNERKYDVVLYGPINQPVTIELWAVILGGGG